MQTVIISELLAALEQTLDECDTWASGSECTQRNASGQVRCYNMLELVTAYNLLEGAAQGQRLTGAQIERIQRAIALTQWH